MSGARIFNAAMDQYQKHQLNSAKIRAARTKNEQDIEGFKLENDKVTAELKLLNNRGKLSDLELKTRLSQYNEYNKQQKAITTGKTAAQDMAEIQTTESMKKAQGVMTQVARTDPEVQAGLGQIIAQEQYRGRLQPTGSGRNFRFERSGSDDLKKRESYTIHQEAVKMMKATDIENPETDGMSYKQKLDYYTDIAKERLTGVKADKVKLPTKIKTRRQAIQYLESQKGMSREEAINWLQNN